MSQIKEIDPKQSGSQFIQDTGELNKLESLKAQFEKSDTLSDISFKVQDKEMYLVRDSWGMRPFKDLIPILESHNLTFMAMNATELIIYDHLNS